MTLKGDYVTGRRTTDQSHCPQKYGMNFDALDGCLSA